MVVQEYPCKLNGRNWILVNLIIKTIMYRIFGSAFTFVVTYSVTGKLAVASILGAADIIGKLIIYYLFERFWVRFSKFLIFHKRIKR